MRIKYQAQYWLLSLKRSHQKKKQRSQCVAAPEKKAVNAEKDSQGINPHLSGLITSPGQN